MHPLWVWMVPHPLLPQAWSIHPCSSWKHLACIILRAYLCITNSLQNFSSKDLTRLLQLRRMSRALVSIFSIPLVSFWSSVSFHTVGSWGAQLITGMGETVGCTWICSSPSSWNSCLAPGGRQRWSAINTCHERGAGRQRMSSDSFLLDGSHTGLPTHVLSQTPGLAPFLAGWTQWTGLRT